MEILIINCFVGAVSMYCIVEKFANFFKNPKIKFLAGLIGAVIGGYIFQILFRSSK